MVDIIQYDSTLIFTQNCSLVQPYTFRIQTVHCKAKLNKLTAMKMLFHNFFHWEPAKRELFSTA